MKRIQLYVSITVMFTPKTNVKHDPEKRWKQPDRLFFGFGACHILAGVFLSQSENTDWYGEWIAPAQGFSGTHVYATNGVLCFDYHGYSRREMLLARFWKSQETRQPGWSAIVERVRFSLLDPVELNKRKHLAPDEYFGDPVARAASFVAAKTRPRFLFSSQ